MEGHSLFFLPPSGRMFFFLSSLLRERPGISDSPLLGSFELFSREGERISSSFSFPFSYLIVINRKHMLLTRCSYRNGYVTGGHRTSQFLQSHLTYLPLCFCATAWYESAVSSNVFHFEDGPGFVCYVQWCWDHRYTHSDLR